MRRKRIVVMGIDPSLKGCAVVCLPLSWGGDWSLLSSQKFGYSLKRGISVEDRIRRIMSIASSVREFAARHGVTHAYVEGYAFSSRDQAHSLGELGGAIRMALVDGGISIVDAPIGTVRSTIVGRIPRGTEPKALVAEALKAAGLPPPMVDDRDITDATAVMNFGLVDLKGYGFVA
jgi:Holliday junction resolvasome RuvABC endonuclease subunit